MDPNELERQRLMDLNNKKQRKNNMTEEQKEAARAKDRARKAKKQKTSKGKEEVTRENDGKNKNSSLDLDLRNFEKRKKEQLSKNCRIQQKIWASRTEEEEEEIQVEKVKKMRKKRSVLRLEGKMLARLQAKEGMREHREHGFIREYKQRKRRKSYDPESWELEPNAISEYFRKKKQEETEQDRKEEKKRKNRIRVERHRLRIKKLLQYPITIENYGEKSEYELVRESNILERETLMKMSGLFD